MDKEETLQIKGIAIILMFWHHLFGCGDVLMLPENQWYPCFGGYDEVLGVGAKICIGLFTAVSGYGLYKTYMCRGPGFDFPYLWKRLGTFLITYWTMVFCVAIPYLICFDKFHPEWLFINLFALLHNDDMLYLSLSWYVKVYIELLLILPLIKFCEAKIHTLHIDILLFLILPLYICRFLPDAEGAFVDWKTNILSSIRLLLVWYPVFHAGVLLAKYKLIEKLCESDARPKFYHDISVFLAVLMILIFVEYRRRNMFGDYTDVLCAGAVILLFDFCYRNRSSHSKVGKVLAFLGKYSFQYWLLSGMFFLNTTEFQYVLVLPRYSLFMLGWKFALITPVAILMSTISEKTLKKCAFPKMVKREREVRKPD